MCYKYSYVILRYKSSQHIVIIRHIGRLVLVIISTVIFTAAVYLSPWADVRLFTYEYYYITII